MPDTKTNDTPPDKPIEDFRLTVRMAGPFFKALARLGADHLDRARRKGPRPFHKIADPDVHRVADVLDQGTHPAKGR